jgi:hypothetical protein
VRIRTLFLLSFAGMFCVLAAISGLGIYSSLKQVRVLDRREGFSVGSGNLRRLYFKRVKVVEETPLGYYPCEGSNQK